MAYRDFKSIFHEKEWFYRIHSSSSDLFDERWAMRNVPIRHVSEHIVLCETYGDGMTQHAPARLALEENFTDVCLSLASDIMAAEEEGLEFYLEMGYMYELRFDESKADFAMTVKYKENKRQWFSVGQQKIGSKPSLQFDTRYKEVFEWMDGCLMSAFRIYQGDTQNASVLTMFNNWVKFSVHCSPDWISKPEYLDKLPGANEHAFHALSRAWDYIGARKDANRSIIDGMAITQRKLDEARAKADADVAAEQAVPA